LLYDIKGGSLRSPPTPAAGGRMRPSSRAHDHCTEHALHATSASLTRRRQLAVDRPASPATDRACSAAAQTTTTALGSLDIQVVLMRLRTS
jgi:hypothetical protein